MELTALLILMIIALLLILFCYACRGMNSGFAHSESIIEPTAPTVPALGISVETSEPARGKESMLPHILPQVVSRYEYETRIKALLCRETIFKTDNTLPREILLHAKKLVGDSNLYIVILDREVMSDSAEGRVAGIGRSVAPGSELAADITVYRVADASKPVCKMSVYSARQDELHSLSYELSRKLAGAASMAIIGADNTQLTASQVKKLRPAYSDQRITLLVTIQLAGDKIVVNTVVSNESSGSVSRVAVQLLSYPLSQMELKSVRELLFETIPAKAKMNARFELTPTVDCIKGEVLVAITYTDLDDERYTVTAEPLPVAAVCILIEPQAIARGDFEKELSRMENGEITVAIENVSTQEVHERAGVVLRQLNFHEVWREIRQVGGLVMGETNGWARGMLTKKGIALSIIVYGSGQGTGCSCRIVVSAEEDRVILQAIDEVRNALGI